MNSRYVFLDFDGVIVTSSSYKRVKDWEGAGSALIEPRLVANVQTLCEKSGARVVISSAWRLVYAPDYLNEMLRDAGLRVDVAGQTPRVGHRGEEIRRWCQLYNAAEEDIVILEDEEDVSPFRHRQVRTTFTGTRCGFTERHLSRALRLWGLS
ncbi:MAG: HAD domain-containing protein [Novosphingobium sp.]